MIARNFTIPGIQGELDLLAQEGAVLAFVEVKMRAKAEPGQLTPEDAINLEKRRNLARMARQFIRARRLENTPWRFDIETTPGKNRLSASIHPPSANRNHDRQSWQRFPRAAFLVL